MLSKLSLIYFIRKLTTRHICLPNCKLCTLTSKKLCYQTREGLWNSSKISSFQHYFIHFYFFELRQTSSPLSLFPPSIKTHNPSPLFPKKNHTRRRPPTNSSSLSFSWPLLKLVYFVQWKLCKYFPPIHGLFILQEPMRIKNDFPSNGI